MDWEKNAKEKFDVATNKMPLFHRTIAKKLIKQSAEDIAQARGSNLVEEQDLAKAFFKEVPPAFVNMAKRLLKDVGLDYQKYVSQSD